MPKDIVDDTRRQTNECYFDFANFFISPIAGKQKFETRCWRFAFSTYVTISDEAFALLLFENNYDRWLDCAQRKDWTHSKIMPKYTTGGNVTQTPKNTKVTVTKKGKASKKDQSSNDDTRLNNNASTAMYQGWSAEGITRFNVLYQEILEERNTTLGSEFDEKFLEYCTGNREDQKRKEKKNDYEYVTCRHDLWCNDVTNENASAKNNSLTFTNMANLTTTTGTNVQDFGGHIDNNFQVDLENDCPILDGF